MNSIFSRLKISMSEHYPNAACRHLADSKMLLDKKRFHGSAYLAGYVVECSLKALIVSPTPPPGVDVRSIGHDLSALHNQLNQMASARQGAWRRQVSSSLLGTLRSFLDAQTPAWNPSMRYDATDPSWQSNAFEWWEMANRCFGGFARNLVTEPRS